MVGIPRKLPAPQSLVVRSRDRVPRVQETTPSRPLRACSAPALRVRVTTRMRAARVCRHARRPPVGSRARRLLALVHLGPELAQVSVQAVRAVRVAVPEVPAVHALVGAHDQQPEASAQVGRQGQVSARTGQLAAVAVGVGPAVVPLVRSDAVAVVRSRASPSARSAQSSS